MCTENRKGVDRFGGFAVQLVGLKRTVRGNCEIADSISGRGHLDRWNDCQLTKKVCVSTHH